MSKGCTTTAYGTKNNANPNTSKITTLLAIKKASVRATHGRRINLYCLDRKMRSRQHDAYPGETLETRGGDAPRLICCERGLFVLLSQ